MSSQFATPYSIIGSSSQCPYPIEAVFVGFFVPNDLLNEISDLNLEIKYKDPVLGTQKIYVNTTPASQLASAFGTAVVQFWGGGESEQNGVYIWALVEIMNQAYSPIEILLKNSSGEVVTSTEVQLGNPVCVKYENMYFELFASIEVDIAEPGTESSEIIVDTFQGLPSATTFDSSQLISNSNTSGGSSSGGSQTSGGTQTTTPPSNSGGSSGGSNNSSGGSQSGGSQTSGGSSGGSTTPPPSPPPSPPPTNGGGGSSGGSNNSSGGSQSGGSQTSGGTQTTTPPSNSGGSSGGSNNSSGGSQSSGGTQTTTPPSNTTPPQGNTTSSSSTSSNNSSPPPLAQLLQEGDYTDALQYYPQYQDQIQELEQVPGSTLDSKVQYLESQFYQYAVQSYNALTSGDENLAIQYKNQAKQILSLLSWLSQVTGQDYTTNPYVQSGMKKLQAVKNVVGDTMKYATPGVLGMYETTRALPSSY